MHLKQIQSIPAHTDRIWDLAVHPTLPLLATASSDKSAQIYSLQTYLPVAQLDENHKRSIRSVAWRPGTTAATAVLATASFDGTVGIWMRDGERYSYAVGADGHGDSDVGLEEWEFVASLEGHENEVKCVAWSGAGSFLATCSRDKSVWVWEADEDNEEYECLAVLQEHSQDVKHVAWHPHEDLLASASYDDTVRLWREDDDDWVCCAELAGHTSTVWGLDFEKAAGSARLVSCSADETVRIWRRTGSTGGTAKNDMPSTFRAEPVHETWALEATLPVRHAGPIYSVSWGERGEILSAGADGKLVIYSERAPGEWAVALEEEDAHTVFEINRAVFSRRWKPAGGPGADEIIISGADDGTVNVWELVRD
ncbi:WD40-repeat-containing domain protein [Dipodascopsis tothii]|uniref:WD40-repeat-containing domain protein n=1 Tax=Dipodascopsis tothii TaxID=44089 RepID=UPI0034D00F51